MYAPHSTHTFIDAFDKMRIGVLLFLCIPQNSTPIHICGNYCGPHWCAGMDIAESECDDRMAPETWRWTGVSCADNCCRAHDACCGHRMNTSSCNRAIVECLHDCHPFSVTCTRDGLPFIAGTIEIAMNIVENWCCGSPCEASMRLNG